MAATTDDTGMKQVGTTDPSKVSLVQITDCHIMADADDRLKGMNTRRSFEAVLQAVRADNTGLDLILATGDLSQDASPESYRYLATNFAETGLPVFWIPGNHDDDAIMHAHLRADCIFDARQILVGNWHIVLLDSTVAGEVGGCVSEQLLGFLDEALSSCPGRHTLVCLHHQALAAGSEWIDRKGLQHSEDLVSTLKTQPDVRGVVWGHVHQQAHQCVDGIEWMSTPSSCIQFKPGSREFAIDDLAPGYRRIDLHADGRIETGVQRVGKASDFLD